MVESEPERRPAARLVHRGLGRVELFDLSAGDMAALSSTFSALAAEGYERLSFHAPLTRAHDFPYAGETCFFLNEDPALRALSFRILDRTLALAAEWGAEHVVTHLTYGPTDTGDEALAARLAAEACARIAGSSRDRGVPVHIEFAAYTNTFHRPDQFLAVLEPHPEVGLCLDIGHAYLGSQARGRDYFADLAALAPHAGSVHLWNTKGRAHNRTHGHTPLHPSQSAADGWIDVARSLAIILEASPAAAIVFEYPIDTLTPRIQAGYDWVAGLVSRHAGDGTHPQHPSTQQEWRPSHG